MAEPVLVMEARGGNVDNVRVIVEGGADVNEVGQRQNCLDNRVPWRGHSEIVVVLLAADADVNQANSEGATPIIFSSGNGRQVVVKLLLDKGATVDAR